MFGLTLDPCHCRDDILLKINGAGKLVAARGLIYVNDSLIVQKISGHSLNGDIHANKNFIYDVNIRAESLSSETISTKGFVIETLIGSQPQLLVADETGRIITGIILTFF